tara:strand:+ start:1615 stop:1965 length:351 start_codon:yes stop_codon:yes gene_type:complete
MVMSFPFITVIEKNERQKRLDAISLKKSNKESKIISDNKNNIVDNNSSKEMKDVETIREKNISEYSSLNDNIICLSNLEEVVFYTSTKKCLLTELYNPGKKVKPPVDYDKYLDLFE